MMYFIVFSENFLPFEEKDKNKFHFLILLNTLLHATHQNIER